MRIAACLVLLIYGLTAYYIFTVVSLLNSSKPKAMFPEVPEVPEAPEKVDFDPYLERAREALDGMTWKEGKAKGLDWPVPRRKVLLLTTWRSGSTFLGEMMSWFPGTFYTYEPLVYFDKLSHHVNQSLRNDFLLDLLNCRFKEDFMRVVSQKLNKYVIKYNKRLYEICSSKLKQKWMCYNHEFVSSLCPSFPIHFAKTVRHRVEDARPLLHKEPDLKIVVLFRDPRATFNSRQKIDWCMVNPVCGDPETVCDHMDRDVEATYKLNKDFPGRVHLLRYEDVSLSPLRHAQALFSFLQLPFSNATERFVSAHTMGSDKSGKHSTFHDSRSHVFKWRTTLEWQRLQSIQQFCSKTFSDLGYRRLESEVEQGNESLNLLTRTDSEVWKYKF